MKRNVLCICALTAMLSVSCSREQVTQEAPALVFQAGWAESDDTRTVLQADGTSVWWSAREEINLFFGSISSAKFTSTNTDPQRLVEFAGNLPIVTGSNESGNQSMAYWAVYPYDAGNTCDGESVTLTVPETQTAVAGSFSDKSFPAIATSQGFALTFYNVCGGACFTVSHEGILSISFTSNDGQYLAGRVRVSFNEEEVPEIIDVLEGTDKVTVLAPEGGFIPGVRYFAAFIPGNFNYGLTVGYKNDCHTSTYVFAKSLNVNRSRFGLVEQKDAELDFGIHHGQFPDAMIPQPVDLGLSVKWASFNVGATSPEGYGNYYAWGETEPYVTQDPFDPQGVIWKPGKEQGYDWASYKWCMGDEYALTKYCKNDGVISGYEGFMDGRSFLEPEDDAAHVHLGRPWRMPTYEEITELKNECTWTASSLNGVLGQTVTGPNGNSIFLPVIGYYSGKDLIYPNWFAEYWSATLCYGSVAAFSLRFASDSDGAIVGYGSSRCCGLPIRAVRE